MIWDHTTFSLCCPLQPAIFIMTKHDCDNAFAKKLGNNQLLWKTKLQWLIELIELTYICVVFRSQRRYNFWRMSCNLSSMFTQVSQLHSCLDKVWLKCNKRACIVFLFALTTKNWNLVRKRSVKVKNWTNRAREHGYDIDLWILLKAWSVFR